jgi:glycosyltransferase involved in cell wall biosynthesis
MSSVERNILGMQVLYYRSVGVYSSVPIMKIAIFSSGFLPVIDGVTVAQINRLKCLSQGGHQVLLLCPDYRAIAAIYPNWADYTGSILPNVRVVNLDSTPYLGIEFERNVSPKSYRRAIQELATFQPDIIHVDEAERMANGFLKFPGVAFAKQHHIPCVSFYHTHFVEYVEDFVDLPRLILRSLQFILKKLFAWVYNAYDLTLVGSSDAYRKISQMGIRNGRQGDFLGIDWGKFQTIQQEEDFFVKKYGIENMGDRIKLLFIGRLTPDKGWKFALNALEPLIKNPNWNGVILVAGDGELHDEIAQRLGSAAHLLGRIPPDDIPALLAHSDIHVTASEKETRGLTVLEALAAGIPTIAPHAGGIPDTLTSGTNGLLYTPGDSQDFTQKLTQLMTDRTLRQTLGTAGRAMVKPYDWEHTVHNLVQVWEEMIENKKRQLSRN